MKVPDEYVAGSTDPRSPPPRESVDTPSEGGLTELLLHAVGQIGGSAGNLIEIVSDRVRLSVRGKIVRVSIAAAVAVFLAAWLVAAALATLRGLSGGLTALWGGREWLGDLTGGPLALALGAGAAALHLRGSSRRELERLRIKYEAIHNDQKSGNNGPPGPHDSSGSARP